MRLITRALRARRKWVSRVFRTTACHVGDRNYIGRVALSAHRGQLDVLFSYSAEYDENDHDKQQEPNSAAGIVAPSRAIRPRRQRAYEKENQNDDQDCREHLLSSSKSTADRQR